MTRAPARPSGSPPPAQARLGDTPVELVPLAEEIARRHLDGHPDDVERYGELAWAWCVHDMQHVLAWAFADVHGYLDLAEQVAWLARVLDARGYPVANLADCLATAGDVVAEQLDRAQAVAARLRAVGDRVRP